ncbi:hypothetical protein BDN72DRAFT_958982 [Pluteus cervinus]|uniref:Uncharacterized protein n=1 Tax=Pluteus cervinus TaxID=181527 RepID=A0ACD3AY33_9AGAR|nr:hypothetical protein BDN72DRAFT_958982 [Pluteus cervinus]
MPIPSALQLRTAMVALPHDVWVVVAQLLAPTDLRSLMGLNSSMLCLALKASYQSVVFTSDDRRRNKRLCQHMLEPGIAPHVREVTIRPWKVVKEWKKPTGIARVWDKTKAICDPTYRSRTSATKVQKAVHKDIRNVMAALARCKGLRHYTIDWDGSPCQTEFFRAFTGPALAEIAGSLTKLTLKVPITALSRLAQVTNLYHLEELEVIFYVRDVATQDIEYHLEPFVVFVNNLPSLKSLSLTSTCKDVSLNLHRFFRHLGHIHGLRHVHLSIPFDGTHLSPPETFVGFLDSHRDTLKTLSLTTSRCSAYGSAHPETNMWIHKIIDSIGSEFRSLEHITLSLRPLGADLAPFIKLLQIHGETLETIQFTDRILAYQEVEILFNITLLPRTARFFAARAAQLRVDQLSPELLVLLARRLPNLRQLEVTFNTLIPRDLTAYNEPEGETLLRLHDRQEVDLFQFCQALRGHKEEMFSWQLEDLKLEKANSKLNSDLSNILVSMLQECLPSRVVIA